MKYGLLGYPLGHSLSPEIHRQLFAREGLEGEYTLLPVPPEEWERCLPERLALDGFNVTIPYKEKVLSAIDALHESARIYRSVNTVMRRPDGGHTGFNTDCDGFLHTLSANGIPLAGSVCVLGAGGVGRMFAIESTRQGALVAVAVRESGLEKARLLQKEISETLGKDLRILPIDSLKESFDLIINATPVGMFPQTEACPVEKEVVVQAKSVFDCIYNPSETLLLRFAREAGVKTAGGMDMLVWQAAVAHTYWHGTQFTEAQISPIIRGMKEAMDRHA